MKLTIKRCNLMVLLAMLCFWFAAPQATAFPAQQDPNDHTGHNHGPGVTHAAPIFKERSFKYSAEVLDAWAMVPVQDGGRVKPLGTLAGFKLLRYNGKRGIKTGELSPEGELTPVGWFLDCVFFPEQASKYPSFVVDLKAVTVALGLNVVGKKKRDRYSYNELATVRGALMLKAQEASGKESKQRSTVEGQILNLSRNFLELEDLLRISSFAGFYLPAQSVTALEGLFADGNPQLPQWLAKSAEIKVRVANDFGPEGSTGSIADSWKVLIGQLEQMRQRNYGGVAFFAPTRSVEAAPEWYTWPELIEACLSGDSDAMDNIPALESIGAAYAVRQVGSQFTAEALRSAEMFQTRAENRGQFARIGMEVDFYHYDFFYRALYFFVLAFLLAAFAWLRSNKVGGGIWMTKGAWAMTLVGLALLITGITYRCVLRQRPPISTLYETILFIAATAVIVALFLEWVTRNRVGLGLAAFIGAFGMFLASRYELQEATTSGDTMPSLGAVLNTNFWLATHVTIINIGYAAGLLAAFLAHVWIYSAFFGAGRGNPAVRKELARMIYGVLCFSLLFSVVGTILGGVWANDSWGRFWGWDPKENGALMICLWQLIILHSRMGGFIRDFGLAIMNVLLAVVVAFSWWGVNLLGVGLHSYGFTEGVGYWLVVFYIVEVSVVVAAVLLKLGRGYGDNKVQSA
ncbi:MAG: ABC-type transport system involved in cytochrome c biogenesis permease subunit [Planctomycetota bacterium]|jgi:ABC-type transport system involved in cytochrome c biogenesis permease subunit